MLMWVLDALVAAGVTRPVVVVGRDGNEVRGAVTDAGVDVRFAIQDHPRGTADAVEVGLRTLVPSAPDTAADAAAPAAADDDLVVLAADAPLIGAATIARLVATRRELGAAATLLSAHLDDPTGYGRIVRKSDPQTQTASHLDPARLAPHAASVAKVVEHVDATPTELRITEVNASAYCFDRAKLTDALAAVTPSAASGERYLTDVVAVLAEADELVAAVPTDDPDEILGANTPDELAVCESILRRRRERG